MPSWMKIHRLFPASLAVLYFFSNCVFSHAAETNIWAERRREARRMASSDDRTGMSVASLPGSLGSPLSAEALRDLPTVTRAPSPSLSQSIADKLPKGFADKYAPLFAALPFQYGSIRNISPPKITTTEPRVVIHIQDVHMNAEAQRNIGRAVGSLIDGRTAGLVALEGAFAPIDLSRFRAFPDHDVIRNVADFLFKQNKISGPVHTAFTSAQDIPPFVGIDDPLHYNANVEAYRRSAPRVEEYRKILAGQASLLAQEKEKTFNPDLLAFDQRIQAYRDEKITLGDYVKTVSAGPRSPQASMFLQALAMEESFDFKQVEAERAQLIERLVQKLTREQINDLAQRGAAYRLGRVRTGDFYRALADLCGLSGVSLSRFPAMDRYIRYVLLADRIDAEKLFAETSALEKAAYARLAKTPEEKSLLAQSAQLALTQKLVAFSLTPAEWAEYRAQGGAAILPMPTSPENEPALTSFESFYKEADARDQAMTENLLAAARANNTGAVVLVTGGYHSPGMAERLTQAGFMVVSFTPKIEKIDTAQGSTYLSVFTQEKTPLEKLFQGEKLFLAQNPLSDATKARAAIASSLMEAWREHSKTVDVFLKQLAPDLAVKLETSTADERGFTVTLKFTGGGTTSEVSVHLGFDDQGKISAFDEVPVDTLLQRLWNIEAARNALVEVHTLARAYESDLWKFIPEAEFPLFHLLVDLDPEGLGKLTRAALLALHSELKLPGVELDPAMEPFRAVLHLIGMKTMSREELRAARRPGLTAEGALQVAKAAQIAEHFRYLDVFRLIAPLMAGEKKTPAPTLLFPEASAPAAIPQNQEPSLIEGLNVDQMRAFVGQLNGVVGLVDFLSKWSRDDQMDRKLRRVLLDGIVRALISLKGGLDAGIFLPGLPRTEVEKLRDFFDQDSTGAEDRKQLLLSNVPFLNTIPKPYRNPSNMSAAFGIMCRRLNSFLEIHEGDALSKKLDRVREYPGMVPIVDLLLEAMKGEPGFLDRSELFGQLLKWETLSKDKSAGSELDKMEDRLFGPPETQTPGPTRRTPSTLAWFWQGKLNHSDIRANVTRRGPRESFVLAILAGMMTAVEASAGTSLWTIWFGPALYGLLWGFLHMAGTYDENLKPIGGWKALPSSALKALVGALWLTAYSLALGFALKHMPILLHEFGSSNFMAAIPGAWFSIFAGFAAKFLHARLNRRFAAPLETIDYEFSVEISRGAKDRPVYGLFDTDGKLVRCLYSDGDGKPTQKDADAIHDALLIFLNDAEDKFGSPGSVHLQDGNTIVFHPTVSETVNETPEWVDEEAPGKAARFLRENLARPGWEEPALVVFSLLLSSQPVHLYVALRILFAVRHLINPRKTGEAPRRWWQKIAIPVAISAFSLLGYLWAPGFVDLLTHMTLFGGPSPADLLGSGTARAAVMGLIGHVGLNIAADVINYFVPKANLAKGNLKIPINPSDIKALVNKDVLLGKGWATVASVKPGPDGKWWVNLDLWGPDMGTPAGRTSPLVASLEMFDVDGNKRRAMVEKILKSSELETLRGRLPPAVVDPGLFANKSSAYRVYAVASIDELLRHLIMGFIPSESKGREVPLLSVNKDSSASIPHPFLIVMGENNLINAPGNFFFANKSFTVIVPEEAHRRYLEAGLGEAGMPLGGFQKRKIRTFEEFKRPPALKDQEEEGAFSGELFLTDFKPGMFFSTAVLWGLARKLSKAGMALELKAGEAPAPLDSFPKLLQWRMDHKLQKASLLARGPAGRPTLGSIFNITAGLLRYPLSATPPFQTALSEKWRQVARGIRESVKERADSTTWDNLLSKVPPAWLDSHPDATAAIRQALEKTSPGQRPPEVQPVARTTPTASEPAAAPSRGLPATTQERPARAAAPPAPPLPVPPGFPASPGQAFRILQGMQLSLANANVTDNDPAGLAALSQFNRLVAGDKDLPPSLAVLALVAAALRNRVLGTTYDLAALGEHLKTKGLPSTPAKGGLTEDGLVEFLMSRFEARDNKPGSDQFDGWTNLFRASGSRMDKEAARRIVAAAFPPAPAAVALSKGPILVRTRMICRAVAEKGAGFLEDLFGHFTEDEAAFVEAVATGNAAVLETLGSKGLSLLPLFPRLQEMGLRSLVCDDALVWAPEGDALARATNLMDERLRAYPERLLGRGPVEVHAFDGPDFFLGPERFLGAALIRRENGSLVFFVHRALLKALAEHPDQVDVLVERELCQLGLAMSEKRKSWTPDQIRDRFLTIPMEDMPYLSPGVYPSSPAEAREIFRDRHMKLISLAQSLHDEEWLRHRVDVGTFSFFTNRLETEKVPNPPACARELLLALFRRPDSPLFQALGVEPGEVVVSVSQRFHNISFAPTLSVWVRNITNGNSMECLLKLHEGKAVFRQTFLEDLQTYNLLGPERALQGEELIPQGALADILKTSPYSYITLLRGSPVRPLSTLERESKKRDVARLTGAYWVKTMIRFTSTQEIMGRILGPGSLGLLTSGKGKEGLVVCNIGITHLAPLAQVFDRKDDSFVAEFFVGMREVVDERDVRSINFLREALQAYVNTLEARRQIMGLMVENPDFSDSDRSRWRLSHDLLMDLPESTATPRPAEAPPSDSPALMAQIISRTIGDGEIDSLRIRNRLLDTQEGNPNDLRSILKEWYREWANGNFTRYERLIVALRSFKENGGNVFEFARRVESLRKLPAIPEGWGVNIVIAYTLAGLDPRPVIEKLLGTQGHATDERYWQDFAAPYLRAALEAVSGGTPGGRPQMTRDATRDYLLKREKYKDHAAAIRAGNIPPALARDWHRDVSRLEELGVDVSGARWYWKPFTLPFHFMMGRLPVMLTALASLVFLAVQHGIGFDHATTMLLAQIMAGWLTALFAGQALFVLTHPKAPIAHPILGKLFFQILIRGGVTVLLNLAALIGMSQRVHTAWNESPFGEKLPLTRQPVVEVGLPIDYKTVFNLIEELRRNYEPIDQFKQRHPEMSAKFWEAFRLMRIVHSYEAEDRVAGRLPLNDQLEEIRTIREALETVRSDEYQRMLRMSALAALIHIDSLIRNIDPSQPFQIDVPSFLTAQPANFQIKAREEFPDEFREAYPYILKAFNNFAGDRRTATRAPVTNLRRLKESMEEEFDEFLGVRLGRTRETERSPMLEKLEDAQAAMMAIKVLDEKVLPEVSREGWDLLNDYRTAKPWIANHDVQPATADRMARLYARAYNAALLARPQFNHAEILRQIEVELEKNCLSLSHEEIVGAVRDFFQRTQESGDLSPPWLRSRKHAVRTTYGMDEPSWNAFERMYGMVWDRLETRRLASSGDLHDVRSNFLPVLEEVAAPGYQSRVHEAAEAALGQLDRVITASNGGHDVHGMQEAAQGTFLRVERGGLGILKPSDFPPDVRAAYPVIEQVFREVEHPRDGLSPAVEMVYPSLEMVTSPVPGSRRSRLADDLQHFRDALWAELLPGVLQTPPNRYLMTRNPSTEILNFWRDHGNPWQQSLAINHPLDAVSLIEETGLWVTPGGNRLQRAVKRFAAFMMGRLPVALTAVVTVGLLTAGVNLGHAWQYLRWWSILVLAFQLVFVITHPYQAVKGHWFLGNRFIQFVVRLFLTAAFNVAAVLPAGLGLALEAFPFLAGPGAMSGIWAALTVGISVMGFMVAAPGVVGGIALSVMAHTRWKIEPPEAPLTRHGFAATGLTVSIRPLPGSDNSFEARFGGLPRGNYRLTCETRPGNGRPSVYHQMDFNHAGPGRTARVDGLRLTPGDGEAFLTLARLDENGHAIDIAFEGRPPRYPNGRTSPGGPTARAASRVPGQPVNILWEQSSIGKPSAPVRPRTSGIYFPQVAHSEFAPPLNAFVYYPVGKFQPMPVREHLGPLYTDFRQVLSEDEEREIVSRAADPVHSVMIAIPTNNESVMHIFESVQGEIAKYREAHPQWQVVVAVGVNDPDLGKRSDLVRRVRDYQANHPDFPLIVMDLPITGKINAMNALNDLAKAEKCDVTQFIDDDIEWTPGALTHTVETLLSSGEASFVGSEIVPLLRVRAWWGRVSSKLRTNKRNPVPWGPSMTLYTRSYPAMPSHGIGDDIYLADYFTDPKAPNPAHRVIVDKGSVVSHGIPVTLLREVLQMTRTEYDHYLLNVFFADKSASVEKRASAAALISKVSGALGKAYVKGEGLSFWRLLRGGIRVMVRLAVTLEMKVRVILGRPRRVVHWRTDQATKAVPGGVSGPPDRSLTFQSTYALYRARLMRLYQRSRSELDFDTWADGYVGRDMYPSVVAGGRIHYGWERWVSVRKAKWVEEPLFFLTSLGIGRYNRWLGRLHESPEKAAGGIARVASEGRLGALVGVALGGAVARIFFSALKPFASAHPAAFIVVFFVLPAMILAAAFQIAEHGRVSEDAWDQGKPEEALTTKPSAENEVGSTKYRESLFISRYLRTPKYSDGRNVIFTQESLLLLEDSDAGLTERKRFADRVARTGQIPVIIEEPTKWESDVGGWHSLTYGTEGEIPPRAIPSLVENYLPFLTGKPIPLMQGICAVIVSNETSQCDDAGALMSEHVAVGFLFEDGHRSYFGGKGWYWAPSEDGGWVTRRFQQSYLEDMEGSGWVFPPSSDLKKVLVLDADGVLWSGSLDEGTAEVTPSHKVFQQSLKALKERGVLLAVNSRNNPEELARALRETPGMVLSPSDFVAVRTVPVGGDKRSVMESLSADLGLPLTSFVFVDDTPQERRRVGSQTTDVFSPNLGADAARWGSAVEKFFPKGALTPEDRSRAEMHVQSAHRNEARQSAESDAAFFKSLNIHLTVKKEGDDSPNLDRVAQLSQRTHQFNATGRTYSDAAELRRAINAGKTVYTVRYQDIFGDSGLVGAMILDQQGSVVDFFLSCRAIGYGVEQSFLYTVFASSEKRETATLAVRNTGRNSAALHAFGSLGEEVQPGLRRFRLDQVSLNVPARVTTPEGQNEHVVQQPVTPGASMFWYEMFGITSLTKIAGMETWRAVARAAAGGGIGIALWLGLRVFLEWLGVPEGPAVRILAAGILAGPAIFLPTRWLYLLHRDHGVLLAGGTPAPKGEKVVRATLTASLGLAFWTLLIAAAAAFHAPMIVWAAVLALGPPLLMSHWLVNRRAEQWASAEPDEEGPTGQEILWRGIIDGQGRVEKDGLVIPKTPTENPPAYDRDRPVGYDRVNKKPIVIPGRNPPAAIGEKHPTIEEYPQRLPTPPTVSEREPSPQRGVVIMAAAPKGPTTEGTPTSGPQSPTPPVAGPPRTADAFLKMFLIGLAYCEHEHVEHQNMEMEALHRWVARVLPGLPPLEAATVVEKLRATGSSEARKVFAGAWHMGMGQVPAGISSPIGQLHEEVVKLLNVPGANPAQQLLTTDDFYKHGFLWRMELPDERTRVTNEALGVLEREGEDQEALREQAFGALVGVVEFASQSDRAIRAAQLAKAAGFYVQPVRAAEFKRLASYLAADTEEHEGREWVFLESMKTARIMRLRGISYDPFLKVAATAMAAMAAEDRDVFVEGMSALQDLVCAMGPAINPLFFERDIPALAAEAQKDGRAWLFADALRAAIPLAKEEIDPSDFLGRTVLVALEVAAEGKEDVDRAVFQDLLKTIQERSVEIKRLVGRELGMRSTVPRILKSFKRDRLPDVFRSICARAKEIGELELPAENPADYLHDIVGAALDFTRDNPDQFEPALSAISEATGSFVKRRGRADREYLMADFVPAALQVSRGNVPVLKVVLSETLRVADGIDDATARWLYLEHTAPSLAQDSSPEGGRTYVSSAKYFDRLGTRPPMERLGKDKQLADIRGATRVGVVGDVHANFRETLDALVTAGYADEEGNWIAPPGAVLVFLGDLVDRGDKPWETLEFIFRLSKDAESKGGRVLALRGNHDEMMLGCLMDSHPAKSRRWAMNDVGGAATLTELLKRDVSRDEMEHDQEGLRKDLFKNYPDSPPDRPDRAPGMKQILSWLAEQPLAARVNGSVLLVHASPDFGADKFEDMAERTKEDPWDLNIPLNGLRKGRDAVMNGQWWYNDRGLKSNENLAEGLKAALAAPEAKSVVEEAMKLWNLKLIVYGHRKETPLTTYQGKIREVLPGVININVLPSQSPMGGAQAVLELELAGDEIRGKKAIYGTNTYGLKSEALVPAQAPRRASKVGQALCSAALTAVLGSVAIFLHWLFGAPGWVAAAPLVLPAIFCWYLTAVMPRGKVAATTVEGTSWDAGYRELLAKKRWMAAASVQTEEWLHRKIRKRLPWLPLWLDEPLSVSWGTIWVLVSRPMRSRLEKKWLTKALVRLHELPETKQDPAALLKGLLNDLPPSLGLSGLYKDGVGIQDFDAAIVGKYRQSLNNRGVDVSNLGSIKQALASDLPAKTGQIYLVNENDAREGTRTYWEQTRQELTVDFKGAYVMLAKDDATKTALMSFGIPDKAVFVAGDVFNKDGTASLTKAQIIGPVKELLARPDSVNLYASKKPAIDEDTNPRLRLAADFWRELFKDLPPTSLRLELIDRIARAILAAA